MILLSGKSSIRAVQQTARALKNKTAQNDVKRRKALENTAKIPPATVLSGNTGTAISSGA
ncbi:MAG: hypothetical protein LBB65_04195 [Burkholderiales bacterium]|jgi:hypothetical protein|nr:hypothetical protein [Burkholderiales bacterium]